MTCEIPDLPETVSGEKRNILCVCFFNFDIGRELKTIATDGCSERHSQKHSLFCDSYLHLSFTSAYKKSSVLVVYRAPNY